MCARASSLRSRSLGSHRSVVGTLQQLSQQATRRIKSPAVQSSAAERGVKGKKGHRTNNCVESCGGAGLCGVLVPPTSVVCCLCTRRILSCYCCCKRNELGFSGLCCDPRDSLEAASG